MLDVALAWLAAFPSPQDPPAGRVVVELRSGEELSGVLRARSPGFVELELQPGAVVGLAGNQVVAIRAVEASLVAPRMAVPFAVAPRSEWFLLYDGGGLAVGWLRSSVQVQHDGSILCNEEYEFVDGARRYQMTLSSRAGPDLAPLECYCRERISEPSPVFALPVGTVGGGDRLRVERIVRAQVVGAELMVQRLDLKGRRESRLPWPAGATFPLLAALGQRAGGWCGIRRVFDAATEQFATLDLRPGRVRTVGCGELPVPITEWVRSEVDPGTAADRGGPKEVVWGDAAGRTVHRELAGPGLVAVPSAPDSAPLAVGSLRAAPALVAETGQRFGLWLPNPAWRPGPSATGSVGLECAAHGAWARLQELTTAVAEPGVDAATMADAVQRWWTALHPDLQLGARQPWTFGGRPAVRWITDGHAATSAQVDLLPAGDRWLLLVQTAPSAAFDELARDFAFVAAHVEWHPAAMATPVQGPLAEGDAPPRIGRLATPSR